MLSGIYKSVPDSILQQIVSGDYGNSIFQAAYACDRFERVWRELQYQVSTPLLHVSASTPRVVASTTQTTHKGGRLRGVGSGRGQGGDRVAARQDCRGRPPSSAWECQNRRVSRAMNPRFLTECALQYSTGVMLVGNRRQ